MPPLLDLSCPCQEKGHCAAAGQPGHTVLWVTWKNESETRCCAACSQAKFKERWREQPTFPDRMSVPSSFLALQPLKWHGVASRNISK